MKAVDEAQILWLVEQELAAMGERGVEPVINPQLELAIDAYEGDLYDALVEFVGKSEPRWPVQRVGEYVDRLMDEGDAPINVLLTLQGAGVGIWDGRWDSYFNAGELMRLQRFLKVRLAPHADDTGMGAVPDAINAAALESIQGYPMTDVYVGPQGFFGSVGDLDDGGGPLLSNSNHRGGRDIEFERAHLEAELSRAQSLRERQEIMRALDDLDRDAVEQAILEEHLLQRNAWTHWESGPSYPPAVDPVELEMGIETEMEHTDDPAVAEQIALDHLAEDPRYYTMMQECGMP